MRAPLMRSELKGLKPSVAYIPARRFPASAADFISGTDCTRTGMPHPFVSDLPESPRTMGRSLSNVRIHPTRPHHIGKPIYRRSSIDASEAESYLSRKGMRHLQQGDMPPPLFPEYDRHCSDNHYFSQPIELSFIELGSIPCVCFPHC